MINIIIFIAFVLDYFVITGFIIPNYHASQFELEIATYFGYFLGFFLRYLLPAWSMLKIWRYFTASAAEMPKPDQQ